MRTCSICGEELIWHARARVWLHKGPPPARQIVECGRCGWLGRDDIYSYVLNECPWCQARGKELHGHARYRLRDCDIAKLGPQPGEEYEEFV